jgi:hypothetical protein
VEKDLSSLCRDGRPLYLDREGALVLGLNSTLGLASCRLEVRPKGAGWAGGLHAYIHSMSLDQTEGCSGDRLQLGAEGAPLCGEVPAPGQRQDGWEAEARGVTLGATGLQLLITVGPSGRPRGLRVVVTPYQLPTDQGCPTGWAPCRGSAECHRLELVCRGVVWCAGLRDEAQCAALTGGLLPALGLVGGALAVLALVTLYAVGKQKYRVVLPEWRRSEEAERRRAVPALLVRGQSVSPGILSISRKTMLSTVIAIVIVIVAASPAALPVVPS